MYFLSNVIDIDEFERIVFLVVDVMCHDHTSISKWLLFVNYLGYKVLSLSLEYLSFNCHMYYVLFWWFGGLGEYICLLHYHYVFSF